MPKIVNNSAITLVKVLPDQKMTLENIMELYVYDFSEYMDFDVDEEGLFHYPLEEYFDSANHRAYFIKVENKLAGCVLQYTYKSDDGLQTQTIGEFFVLKKYRKQGVGFIAAKAILNKFPGNWLVYESKKNIPAQIFWRKVISECTNDSYKEYYKDEKPHQIFSILPIESSNEIIDAAG